MLFALPVALLPIYAVIFLDVLGLTILIPLLPALADRLHASAVTLGLALSVTALCATLSSPLWGGLSDRVGRKAVLQASQTFSFVGYAVLALSNSVPLLFVSRAIEGLGGGNLGVAQSYIADLTAPDQRERGYAFGAAAFGIGFVVGPVLAGQLLRLGHAVPFWTAAGMQLANFALTAFLLKKTEASQGRAPQPKAVVEALRAPRIRNLLGRQWLYIFSFTYFFTIFSLYLARELNMPPQESSLFLAVAGGIGTLVQIFAVARLSERFGPGPLAQLGFALSFVAYAGMFFIGKSVASFVAILVVWAIGGSLLQPTLNALIAAAAPPDKRGAILGFVDSLNNFSLIVAPATAGAILGLSPAAIGVAPALAVATAFALGLRSAGPARRV